MAKYRIRIIEVEPNDYTEIYGQTVEGDVSIIPAVMKVALEYIERTESPKVVLNEMMETE